MDLLKIKPTVNELLEKNTNLRDDDYQLLARVWEEYLTSMGFNTATMTAKQLIAQISSGNLPNSESVRRSRAKLQEVNPELRGSKYYDRHNHAEDVKKQLKEF